MLLSVEGMKSNVGLIKGALLEHQSIRVNNYVSILFLELVSLGLGYSRMNLHLVSQTEQV